jgi:hypothetical protein
MIPYEGNASSFSPPRNRAVNRINTISIKKMTKKREIRVKKLSLHQKHQVRSVVGQQLLKGSNCLGIAKPPTVP